ncbi:I78 family peptidase inhibitor [Stenotrophomonas sp.]|uniref:I78 family peptidase inhibitor n=1 Tax=Stenotrophomonas sp. TaxID=69392 RepID=UPI0028B1A175|nr:I78 family peptidase inhibitor [Stenotrophomonas sp.]
MTAIRLSLLLPAAALLLSACVSTPGPQVKGSGHCDASQLGWAVGQPANEANMRRLSSESGAGLVNPIGPNTITTKDIRPDRLRVFVDKDNIITAAHCE